MTATTLINPEPQIASKLFDLIWEEIPIIKKTDVPLNAIKDSDTRIKILWLISQGIDDPTINSTRHILSRTEIHDEINKLVDEQVTLHNIYFHVKKLVEFDMMKEVAKIKNGRRAVAYFTRTAKHFVYVNSDENKIWEEIKNNLTFLIMQKNPDIKKEKVEALFESYEEWQNYGYEKGIMWYEDNYPNIVANKVPTGPIYEFLGIILSFKNLDDDRLKDLINLADLIFPMGPDKD